MVGHFAGMCRPGNRRIFCGSRLQDVPQLWNLGFPIAIMDERRRSDYKIESDRGHGDRGDSRGKMLYEIQDPANYFTPDVIAGSAIFRLYRMVKTVSGMWGIR